MESINLSMRQKMALIEVQKNFHYIVEILREWIYAAKLATDFNVQDNDVSSCLGTMKEICYKNWYFPSKYALNLLEKRL